MSSNLSTPEVLEAAAEEIRQQGHHKGWFWRDGQKPNSPCCVLGAIRRVVPHYYGDPSKWVPVCDALRAVLPIYAIDVWNDAPERTAAEVITALREAAARLRTEAAK